MIKICRGVTGNWEEIWPIFHAVVSAGDTYAYPPEIEKEEAFAAWFGPETTVYTAALDGLMAGSYILRPNMPGLGSSVANASFMVHPDKQGCGIGRAMGVHTMQEAKKAGFTAMQFNLVVSTNTAALALWKTLGFSIAGTLPKAFNHRKLGPVDAFVMHRFLN